VVVILIIIVSLGNAAYMFWVISLNIDNYRNSRGSLRRWKKMNDDDLLKSLLARSGVASGSEVERLTDTILEPGKDE
jgi:hypothetical protein